MKTIFKFDLGLYGEYGPLVHDWLKWISCYTIFNFLSSYSSGLDPFSTEYFNNVIYLMIALAFYHLVIMKAILIV